eukprot:GHVQ01012382.1.p1 GENE.GHVQ01012382.1~~GHVQ01012382.1.p1  ORF type:complete len:717 (+),score=118.67 GHVQ01012382.1:3866-6016(+)
MSSLEISVASCILSGTFGECPAAICRVLLLKGSLTLSELFESVRTECGMSFDMVTTSLLILLQHNIVISVLSVPGLSEPTSSTIQSTPSPSAPSPLPLHSSSSPPSCKPSSKWQAGRNIASPSDGNEPQIPPEVYKSLKNGVSGFFKYEAILSEIMSRIRYPRFAAYVEDTSGRDSRVLFCQFAKYGRLSMSKALSAATSEYNEDSYALLLDPQDYVRFCDGTCRPPSPPSTEDLQKLFIKLIADNVLTRCSPAVPPLSDAPSPSSPPTLSGSVPSSSAESVATEQTGYPIAGNTNGTSGDGGGGTGTEIDLFADENKESQIAEEVLPQKGKRGRGRGSRGVRGRGRGAQKDSGRGGAGVGGSNKRRKTDVETSPLGTEDLMARQTTDPDSASRERNEVGQSHSDIGAGDLNSLSHELLQIIQSTTGAAGAALGISGTADGSGGAGRRSAEKEQLKNILKLYEQADYVFRINCRQLNLLLCKQFAEDFIAARFVESDVVRFVARALLDKVRFQGSSVARSKQGAGAVYAGHMNFAEIEREVCQMAAAKGKRTAERKTLLTVLDAMSRHRDKAIHTQAEGANTMYSIDWNRLVFLVKGRLLFDSVYSRCGESAARIWSVLSESSRESGAESVPWDDKSVANTALVAPNKARESLYVLVAEGFARMQESDVTTLPNPLSSRHAIVFSAEDSEVTCNVFFFQQNRCRNTLFRADDFVMM